MNRIKWLVRKAWYFTVNWQWRDLAKKQNVCNTKSFICSLTFKLFQTNEASTANGRNRTHGHAHKHTPHTHTHMFYQSVKLGSTKYVFLKNSQILKISYVLESLFNKIAGLRLKLCWNESPEQLCSYELCEIVKNSIANSSCEKFIKIHITKFAMDFIASDFQWTLRHFSKQLFTDYFRASASRVVIIIVIIKDLQKKREGDVDLV